jgi:hypothetical protein
VTKKVKCCELGLRAVPKRYEDESVSKKAKKYDSDPSFNLSSSSSLTDTSYDETDESNLSWCPNY